MNKNCSPLSGRSLENIWTAERSFFKWCLEKKYIRKRPDLQIEKPKYCSRIVKPLSCDDVQALLDASQYTKPAQTSKRKSFVMPRPTAKRDLALIMVLAETGTRVSECARLRWQDIDFKNNLIDIKPFGTGRKTKARILSMGKRTKSALWDYLMYREEKEQEPVDPNDFIFYTVKGVPMDRNSIRCVLGGIGETAGIVNVHPHRFRHFFTSERAVDNTNESTLMYELGVTTTKVVRRYTHINDSIKKSLVDRLKLRKS
jgi:integrase